MAPFALPNNQENIEFLKKENIPVKQITGHWIFFSATPEWIQQKAEKGMIKDFYYEYLPPALLDDTARVMHEVNQVHDGISPLTNAYTGKDVIVGIVDQGLDHNHPDFIDSLGNKRVIRYWDHTVTNPTQSPAPYNYGQIWYPAQINDGSITSSETTTGHGTTVAGMAVGNGRANGRNKGMAPEADIIIVETNFNLPNWQLTIADACDFIFRVADSLNKPAVVNLSLGSYLGSHDATDPAAEYIDYLLDQKKGRIVVAAAGNSGNQPPYHVHNDITSDTSFVWFEANTINGNPQVLFHLWTDISNANFDYAFGANLPSPDFSDRASTIYRNAASSLVSPVYDTLYNELGDRIATIKIFTEFTGDNFHLRGFLDYVDSTNYLLRFSTTGSGSYDLWSGTFLGMNKIVDQIPGVADYPPIVNYVLPDNLQSIVSSWNCSPKVVSVGNLRCRLGHIDNNGNQYYPADMTNPGKISPTSSRGPTRKGVIKPDISASGDVTLASGPFWILNNPSYNTLIDEGGFHVRNGGTSMAAPVVSGIAALYLEKCPNSSWQDFKNDMISTAYSDGYTGVVPNYSYGFGKISAFELMKRMNGDLQILGDSVLCETPLTMNASESLNSYFWSTGENTAGITVNNPVTVYVSGVNDQGCMIYSDTLQIDQGTSLPKPAISILGQSMISTNAPNYQWFLNDSPIPGETQQFIYPNGQGYYSVGVLSPDGCYSFSNAKYWSLGLNDYESAPVKVFPNPTRNILHIQTGSEPIKRIRLLSVDQKIISDTAVNSKEATLATGFLATGIYFLEVTTAEHSYSIKFFKE
ncbi:MAG: S8 family peptidase [Brumimicrobium sp.]|nr:S8 family peptidase [Brumimicrobium sp.]